MKTATLQYMYEDNFKSDCQELKDRNISFTIDGLSITVPAEHKIVLTEFKFAYFTGLGDSIGIVNNEGECFGHTKSEPLTCPKKAAELFSKAVSESSSWYYVLNPQNNDVVKHS